MDIHKHLMSAHDKVCPHYSMYTIRYWELSSIGLWVSTVPHTNNSRCVLVGPW